MMKRLDEIVKEELLAYVQVAGSQQSVIANRVNVRLQQDPALKLLVDQYWPALIMICAMPVHDHMKKEPIEVALVSIVQMWERANQRFNDQLQPKQ